MRAALAAVAVLLLAGCGADPEPVPPAAPTGSAAPSTSAQPTPELDLLAPGDAAAITAAAGSEAEILGLTGSYDRAVALVAPEDGPLLLVTLSEDTGGVSSDTLTAVEPGHPELTVLLPGVTDRVPLIGVAGGRLVSVLVEDGEVLRLTPLGDLAAADVTSLRATAYGYNEFGYLTVTAPDGSARLLKVNLITGELLAEVPLGEGPVRPAAVDTTEDGAVVAVPADVGPEGSATPVLLQFDAGLAPLATVPLGDAGETAGPVDSGAWDFATAVSDGEVTRLVSVEHGEAEAEELAELDRPLPAVLANDTDVVYVAGETHDAVLTWVAVDPGSGEAAGEDELCSAGSLDAADVVSPASGGWLAARCADGEQQELLVWAVTY
ncbi:hypothetical protein [Blastococcus sp. SYSU D00820]